MFIVAGNYTDVETMVAERKPLLRLSRRWWEQTALDILGIRAGNAAA